jgi:hypothetical protein
MVERNDRVRHGATAKTVAMLSFVATSMPMVDGFVMGFADTRKTGSCHASSQLQMVAGFKFPSFTIPGLGAANRSGSSKKQQLLDAISFTANGKDATPEKQAEVLRIVSDMERTGTPDDALLANPALAQKLDGTWYLQWTSPSNVGDKDQFPVGDGMH